MWLPAVVPMLLCLLPGAGVAQLGPSGFVQHRWTGAWGSDGPINTGDLNGDGKTDVFMWRDTDKSWTVNLSTGTGFVQHRWTGAWGSDGPIRTGDLNGDGKTDVFMWRDTDKAWTVNLSTGGGFAQRRWVGACGSDGPVLVGDFNGDHRQDVTVWRDDFKQWMTNLSLGSGFTFQVWDGAWGSDGPILTGDLDGDGRTDVFMWRNSDKDWTVNLSIPVALGPAAAAPACETPTWRSLGPYTLAGLLNFQACAGKVDDIQLSPDYDGQGHPAMYLAGASSSSFLGFGGGGGGIWRSANFTSQTPAWLPLIDQIPGLSDAERVGILDVPSLAVHPAKPRTIYAATNASPTALLESNDGGDSWKVIARGQLGTGAINRVTVDPAGIIYVATTAGFYLSETGGNTFTEVSGTLTGLAFDDVIWHSFENNQTTFEILAAATDRVNLGSNSETGIYRLQSQNGVYLWQKGGWLLQNMKGTPFPASSIEQMKLSTTPGAGAAASLTTADNNPGLLNVYRASKSASAINWSPQWMSQTLSFNTGGGYTLGVAMTPDGRFYAGGVGLGQSDGQGGVVNIQDGSGFVVGNTIHHDEHVILYSPYDLKVYVGTDGGLFRFTPKADKVPGVSAWESVNTSSLRNSLSESVAFSPADPLIILAGHQDNGMASNADGSWKSVGGNEGERMYFDPNDPLGKTAYAWDASGPTFFKSTDGGRTFTSLSLPIASNVALAFHPSEKDRFIVSFNNGSNQYTVQETKDGWTDLAKLTDLKPPITGLGAPTALAYVGDFRYVAASGRLFQGKVDAQGTMVWNATPLVRGPKIVSVSADPARPGAVYFATLARVFFKADQADNVPWTVGGGGNLQDVTGSGPTRVPFTIRRLAVMSNRGAPALYVATVGGVFKGTRSGGPDMKWVRLGLRLPDVLVSDVAVSAATHHVYASLFGRGAFYLVDYTR
jgi:hypothetical protein